MVSQWNITREIFKSHTGNGLGRLVPDLFLFFRKAWGKIKLSAAYSQYLWIALNLENNQSNMYKASDYWSADMLNFDFWEKGLGLVSPTQFAYNFSRKIFRMLYSINRPNFIVWLPLFLKILGNMCIAVVC